MKKQIKMFAIWVISGACMGLAVWGITMVGAKAGYHLFYGDQVHQTIQETVKPECLKGGF
jgi:hypothetical protein